LYSVSLTKLHRTPLPLLVYCACVCPSVSLCISVILTSVTFLAHRDKPDSQRHTLLIIDYNMAEGWDCLVGAALAPVLALLPVM